MKTWNDATTAQVWETLDRIGDARGLYALDHFPDDVRKLVARDYKRIFSGETADKQILAADGTIPEAMNAVMGIELAQRIARERKLKGWGAWGFQKALRQIKGAFRVREFAEVLPDGEYWGPQQ